MSGLTSIFDGFGSGLREGEVGFCFCLLSSRKRVRVLGDGVDRGVLGGIETVSIGSTAVLMILSKNARLDCLCDCLVRRGGGIVNGRNGINRLEGVTECWAAGS